MKDELATEMETYRRELPALLADPEKNGKFVLIRGNTVAGFFPTVKEAIDTGHAIFGVVPFLAKRIVEREEPLFFPRMLNRADYLGIAHEGRSSD
jgi:hypothetical protein